MEVAACPQCASLALHMPTIADGVWPGGGETNFQVCASCAYRGAPMLFDREADYLAFKAALTPIEQAPPPPEAPQRAMAVFIAMVGIAIMAGGLGGAAAGWADPDATRWASALSMIATIVVVLVGWAFVRIAARSWRPTPT